MTSECVQALSGAKLRISSLSGWSQSPRLQQRKDEDEVGSRTTQTELVLRGGGAGLNSLGKPELKKWPEGE